MNDHVISKFSKAIFDTDMVPTRITLAVAEIIWGFLLIFEAGTHVQNPSFAFLISIFPEYVWALILFITGLIQINIIIRESFYDFGSRMFALWDAGIWFFVVMAMLFSTYPPQAELAAEVALMLGAGWIWLKPIILIRGIIHVRSVSQ